MQEKIFIKNRKNQKVRVLIELVENSKGIVFIAHGLAGFIEQPHIQVFAEGFQEASYSTIRWDATNALGQSDGNLEYANLTGYYEDFQDVIDWAKTQLWYKEPFIVAGHSLGAACCLLYALTYPGKLKGLAPISTFISGDIYASTFSKEFLEKWKKEGRRLEESRSKPGIVKKISWSLMEDLYKYDLLEKTDQIKLPLLLITGDQDEAIPANYQQILLDKIPSERKELYFIKDAPHSFIKPEHLTEVKEIIKNWANLL